MIATICLILAILCAIATLGPIAIRLFFTKPWDTDGKGFSMITGALAILFGGLAYVLS